MSLSDSEKQPSERRSDPSLQASVKLILREYAEALVIAVILALILRSFVVAAYKIPTGSMTPNLKVGDFILAYKLPYGFNLPFTDTKFGKGQPQRGDVVVFDCPQNRDLSCVKRVVGLPGDRVEVVKKRLVVNGEMASYKKVDQKILKDTVSRAMFVAIEEKLNNKSRVILVGEDEDRENFGPTVVPPGHFFVLGDHRDTSDDSRFWGPIPMEYLNARAFVIWMSMDWSATLATPSWPRVRWERLFQSVN